MVMKKSVARTLAASVAALLCVGCSSDRPISSLDKKRLAAAAKAGFEYILFPSPVAEGVFLSMPDRVTFVDEDGVFEGAKGKQYRYLRFHDHGTILGGPDVLSYIHWVQTADGENRVWYIAGLPVTGDSRVPVFSDGDAADLYRRITGKKNPALKGALSKQYVAFLARIR